MDKGYVPNASNEELNRNAANGLARGLNVLAELGEQPLRAFLLVVIADDGQEVARMAYGGLVRLCIEVATDELNDVELREARAMPR